MSKESFSGSVAVAITVVKAMIEICPKHVTAFCESDVQILETIRQDFGDNQEIKIERQEGGSIVFRIITDDEHLTEINKLRQHLEVLNVAVELLQQVSVEGNSMENGPLVAEVTRPSKQSEKKEEKMKTEKHCWKDEEKPEAEQKKEEQKAEEKPAEEKTAAAASEQPSQPSMAVKAVATVVKVAAVAGIAYGAFRLYKHFTSTGDAAE
jgi:flagellar biosynthesis GTPase FlhF